LNPELKIIGGKKKLKNASCENPYVSTFVIPRVYQNKIDIAIPAIIVAPVSCPMDGLYFSMTASPKKKKIIIARKVTKNITNDSSLS